MKVGEAVAEIMKREGIEILCGYPVNHLLEYAAKADIRPVIVRQERIGLHMADAISRVTSGKKIGAFCMQHGPGAENAYGGVAQAYSRVGAVAGAAAGLCAPHRLYRSELQFLARDGGRRQVRGAGDRSGRTVPTSCAGRSAICATAAPARRSSKSPPTSGTRKSATSTTSRSACTRYGPDMADVRKAAAAILAAKRPVIYAGTGVQWAEAWPQLRAFAELLGAPVTTSLGGKSSFPENHPLSLGSGGNAVPKPVHHFVENSDLIIGIGCSFTETNFGIKFPKGKKFIHATLDPNHLNKDVVSAIGLVGDAGLTLDALIGELKQTIKIQSRHQRSGEGNHLGARRVDGAVGAAAAFQRSAAQPVSRDL